MIATVAGSELGAAEANSPPVPSLENPALIARAPFQRAGAVTLTPVEWYGDLEVGALTLLEGHAGCGKTFVAIDIAARVTRGDPFPGTFDPTEPGDVLVLDYENGPGVMAARLNAAGANMQRVHLINSEYSECDLFLSDAFTRLSSLGKPANIAYLERAIRQHYPKARMVVLDGIVGALGNSDPNDESKVRTALLPLCNMLRRMGLIGLGIKHFRKETGRNSRGAGAGSQAWRAVPRGVFQVWEVAGVFHLSCEKQNNKPLGATLTFKLSDLQGGSTTPHVIWTSGSTLTARQLARLAADEEEFASPSNPSEPVDLFDILFPDNSCKRVKELLSTWTVETGRGEGRLRKKLKVWVQSGRLSESAWTGQGEGVTYSRAPEPAEVTEDQPASDPD